MPKTATKRKEKFIDKALRYERACVEHGNLREHPRPVWQLNRDARVLELPRLDGRGVEDSYPLDDATEELAKLMAKTHSVNAHDGTIELFANDVIMRIKL